AAAALNVDDAFGRQLAAELGRASGMTVARFSANPETADADIVPLRVAHTDQGIVLEARTPSGAVHVASTLVGAHNAANLLAALAIAWLLGLDLPCAAEGLSRTIQVPGRLERCDEPGTDDVVVLVDYAPTPDALERVLGSVRPIARAHGAHARVVCVFGCGGDRDPGKRPRMGAAVARG